MIILHAEGQTCNKLFTYLSYMADSIDSGEKIIILAPDITTRDYPNLLNSKIIRFPFYFERIANVIGYNTYVRLLYYAWGNKISLRILMLLFKFIPSIKFVKAPTGSYKSKKRKKYEGALKNFFLPNNQIRTEVDSFINTIRVNDEIICGVHIRYGDYRTWLNGKYYYTDKQYHDLMLNVKKIFHNRNVYFLISSNEKIDLSVFKNCNCISIPNSSSTKDLYGLSTSDLIMGPPSTFSGWASYYGNIPLYFIEDPKVKITRSSFKNISEIWD